MNTENNRKTTKEHLVLINQKFDELDILIIDYLNEVRRMGGTVGFCVGSIHTNFKYNRERLNNMCGKFPPYGKNQ
jgi:hypothetical protein